MSDSFFEEVDSLGVSELHISRLLQLEESEAGRVIDVYRRVRDQLRTRLGYWQGAGPDRFTAQRLRGVLYQVQGALDKLTGNLTDTMIDGAERASIFSIENLETELIKYEDHFTGAVMPINLDALAYATDTKNFLIEQYQVSMDRWAENVRARIQESLMDGIASESTNEEMMSGLLGNWAAYEWELRRIVRTEIHSVYNKSKVRGMRDVQTRQLPDLMKALLHPMDKRTAADSIYLAELNPIMPIDEPFHYTWSPPGSKKRYPRTFMAPPDRPNDRGILIPYRRAWDDGEGALFQNIAER